MPGIARWIRCLARPGARLCGEDPREQGGCVRLDGGDRRRRPLARVQPRAVRQAIADGLLIPSEDGYRLSEPGRAALKRLESGTADFAVAHRDMEARSIRSASGRIAKASANRNESPLAKWSERLTSVQIMAGETFHRDYLCSTLTERVTQSWSVASLSGVRSGSKSDDGAPIGRLAARDRVMTALDRLGPGLEAVVLGVLVREESLASIERRFGWAQRSGTAVLGVALDQLAGFYGLTPPSPRHGSGRSSK